MKQYVFGLALLGLASHAFAQNEVDALRYSRLQFGGPARTQAIGGANTALGGDLGNLTSNPAGLGLMRRSEISFTPGISTITTKAKVINPEPNASAPQLNDTRNNLHIASLALAISNRRPDDDTRNWRGGTFAVGFTRVNDFNAQFNYRHTVSDNRSLFQRLREPRTTLDDIEDQDVQGSYSNLDGLAYGSYLTDFGNNGNSIIISQPLEGRTSAVQEETVLTTGSQTQFDLAYGGSYQDKLYVGGGIGIIGARYKSTSELLETNGENSGGSFGSLLLRDEVQTTGSGFNARFGFIYRPIDWLRVGGSVQSPTWYGMEDSYNSSLQANYSKPITVNGQSISTQTVRTEPGVYNYSLTTPWRLNGGVAAIIGKYGFITGDVELVDYSNAKLRNASDMTNGDNYSFEAENSNINALYQQAINVRVGAEGRFDAFRLRAGFAQYGDPYVNSAYDRAQRFITGGVGLRLKNAFVDLTGVYNTSDRLYQPYTLRSDLQPRVAVATNRFTTTFTVGTQF
jgi:hypothetical protein